MTRLRLAVATTSYPRGPGDFSGGFVRDLNVGMAKLGVETTTFAPFSEAARDDPSDGGGPVVRVRSAVAADAALFYGDGMEANAERLGPIRTFRAVARFGAALRSAVAEAGRERPFDATLAHWAVPTARALARRGAPPVVAVCHGGDARFLERPCVGRALAFGLKGRIVGAVAVSSRAQATIARRAGLRGEETLVTPMGIDVSAYAPRAGDPPRRANLVLAVGRLTGVKGFDVLLRAAARIAASGLGALDVEIVGDGPERANLEATARALGVGARFLGALPKSEAAAAMRRATIVAVPSRALLGGGVEGTPTVVFEALAAGAAVVGCATGGLVDVLPEAALAPPDSAEALARLLSAAAANPADFRSPRAGVAFDRDVVAERVVAFVESRLRAASTRAF